MAEEAHAPTDSPSDEQVVQALRAALRTADLSQTTERALRQQLEKQFDVELTDRKPLIRAEVERFLAEQEPIEEEEEGDGEEPAEEEDGKSARRPGTGGGSALSEAMQAFLGEQSLPRPQVVKRIWEYIKENNLQDPSNKRNIIVDERLATIFTPPINMFNMNKQLSKHVFTGEGGGQSAPRKRKSTGGATPSKKKAAGEGGSRKGGGGFTKQLRVTPELAEWLGRPEISRPELTSFFHSYIKEKDIKDPADKRFVLCDDSLRQLTGVERMQAFSFMKYLNRHLLTD